MSQPQMSRADRGKELWRLSTAALLHLYNESAGIEPGTAEGKGVPKESMVRSILLKEGYGEEDYTRDY